MNIFELYKSKDLEDKREIRNEIVKICEIQQSSFYCWLQRGKFPKKFHNRISNYLNIPSNELFTVNQNELLTN